MLRKPHFLNLVKNGEFKELFISELGWEKYKGQSTLPVISIDEKDYIIETIAVRSGFQILLCEVDELPTQSIVKKIDTKLRRQAQDYICIFRLKNSSHDIWTVPVRTNEKRDIVLVEYDNGNAEAIYQKIEGITFDFDEQTNIVDLRSKVQGVFIVNSEKITKDFYSAFTKEHKAFAEFISGIDDHIKTKDNRKKQWYTSVMLNRMMFCYFIQKKGFLNFDTNYLREKLQYVKANEGKNQFYNFYRSFLCQLFSDGLNAPRHTREFEQTFGKIPFLNGGMFDQHQLEREFPEIDIEDAAFERLFDFFDKWNWHLDTRITASGKDINPDVLGYIFEQYINDRAQMGAYYTKEDITEYIGRNCILPFLFDKVKNASKDSEKDFAPDGFVWKTLKGSGDKYIFDAVKKGYKQFDEIPSEISKGIITEEMKKEYSETPIGDLPDTHIPLSDLRAEWNKPTPEKWGLPTEIWRESIERMQRCRDILHKIESGEITSINDFIPYNLDIRNFALDIINTGSSAFVKRFYEALQNVTVLDPTCGSGAFLFAAMNILEPLYEACIDRMQEFNRENPLLFKKELSEITAKYRSNIQYFIFKSIILRNLYGVDIMVEATEIAKLRLFLKMVAVVDVDRRAENLGLDPLPDIDFNIRCGNTLVGYANKQQLEKDLSDNQGSIQIMEANDEFKKIIEDELEIVANAYEIFKEVQLKQEEDMAAFKQAKSNLSERLKALNYQLNQRLWKATGSDLSFDKWLSSHQPFNWLSEFYQIIQGNGGFDVIIGNPPYVIYKPSNFDYHIKDYLTFNSKNLYVYVLERSLYISNHKQFVGFIVPLSFGSGKKNDSIRTMYQSNGNLYVSSYEIRPAKLFDGTGGAEQRLNIVLKISSNNENIYTSQVRRWNNEFREFLFKNLLYSNGMINNTIWRFSNACESNIFAKYNKNKEIRNYLTNSGNNIIYYRSAGLRYWIIFSITDFGTQSASNKEILLSSCENSYKAFCVLSSNLYWWYYACNYDMFNQTLANIQEFKCSLSELCNFELLACKLDRSQITNRRISIITRNNGLINESYAYDKKLSKPIIDEIDKILAVHYGFTDEELDFIINYDIKYRMGDELTKK